MEKTKKVLKIIYDILKKIIMLILKVLKAIWSVKILRPVIIIVILIAIYLYMRDEATLRKFDDFTWPTNELVNTIEKYNTKRGKVGYNSGKDRFTMDLLIGSKNDFMRYIEKNKKKGYDLEQEFDGEVYKAKNRNNNLLSLKIKYTNKASNYYAKSSMMTVTIKKEESKEEKEKQELEAKRKADTEAKEAEERAKKQKAEEEQEQKKTEAKTNTIDPQFKKAMDSYESAMKEYSSFMKKYTSSSNPVSMMTDYNRIMEKYTNANNEFNKIKKESLNSAELAYYLEVQSRVVKNMN